MTGQRRRTADEVDAVIAEWSRARPDTDTSSIGTIGRIARLAAIQTALLREVDEQLGVGQPAFDVMACLRRGGSPYRKTAGELAQSSMLTAGGLTLRLDRLEDDGWVRRTRSDTDRRVVYVELTARGLRTIDIVLEKHLASERRLLDGIPAGKRAALNDLLRTLLLSYESARNLDATD